MQVRVGYITSSLQAVLVFRCLCDLPHPTPSCTFGVPTMCRKKPGHSKGQVVVVSGLGPAIYQDLMPLCMAWAFLPTGMMQSSGVMIGWLEG